LVKLSQAHQSQVLKTYLCSGTGKAQPKLARFSKVEKMFQEPKDPEIWLKNRALGNRSGSAVEWWEFKKNQKIQCSLLARATKVTYTYIISFS
jgi:hypothetical protein